LLRKNDTLRLSENLDAKAVDLLNTGLRNLFPQLCNQMQQESAKITSNAKTTRASKEASIKADLEKELLSLTPIFHRALVDAIVEKFPQVFLGTSPSCL
jgi:hypothetical protein